MAAHRPSMGGKTYQLNQPPILHQRALILDVIAAAPRLDLVSHPLQLFDLRLEIILQLVFRRGIGGVTELFKRLFKDLDADSDLFKGFVDFGYTVSSLPKSSDWPPQIFHTKA